MVLEFGVTVLKALWRRQVALIRQGYLTEWAPGVDWGSWLRVASFE
jgi:hypothetical protein